MYRFSNTVIGFLNLFTLLASIPIIGAGLWMARSSTTCESFLQTPLLVLGFVVLIISLAGFIGACFHVAWALWVYLVVMLFLIGALMGLTIFGFVVTSPGGGADVAGRIYKEYHLDDYSPWLRKRVEDGHYWMTIRSCILGSKACGKIVLWTPFDYLTKDLSPIQLTAPYIPVTHIVGLLQAPNGVQLRGGDDGGAGPRLLPLEQRADGALLRVRLLQGRRARRRPPELAQAVGPQHRDGGDSHRNILHWLLRLSERQESRDRLSVRP
ncbi:hypothetical protein DH2020_030056 [Rehmannia glutinosa]|uniref:Tetraspanin-6 n=1 Tax=Rehmannia glutinosa TaxID=99300 RepID=A0ABR0VMT4_REHGL